MSETIAPVATAREPILHPFEFRGTGREFFRIWIVNVALTLITLGIYSAWAKVRTRRYFYGNTVVAGHSFDYHASPKRILIGRLIAVALFVGYDIGAGISPLVGVPLGVIFFAAVPWLIVASRRFNARNTSYRNVRFNFTGSYGGALTAYILWPIAGVLTLGALVPMAHRARDYYFIDHHSYGGRSFNTEFPAWSIYKIYLVAFALFIGLIIILATAVVSLSALGYGDILRGSGGASRPVVTMIAIIGAILSLLTWTVLVAYIRTKVYNIAVGHTVLDGRYLLDATLSPWAMIWIGVTNLILILVTIGLFYPWARVRLAKYMADNMGILATSDLDGFTSEIFATQGAIGEEIAGFFDYDIGL